MSAAEYVDDGRIEVVVVADAYDAMVREYDSPETAGQIVERFPGEPDGIYLLSRATVRRFILGGAPALDEWIGTGDKPMEAESVVDILRQDFPPHAVMIAAKLSNVGGAWHGEMPKELLGEMANTNDAAITTNGRVHDGRHWLTDCDIWEWLDWMTARGIDWQSAVEAQEEEAAR